MKIITHLSGWNLLTKQSMEMLTVSGLQWHLVALLPYSTHLGVAKLVLSAQLKPTGGELEKPWLRGPAHLC